MSDGDKGGYGDEGAAGCSLQFLTGYFIFDLF
jgi:hypothetical protein